MLINPKEKKNLFSNIKKKLTANFDKGQFNELSHKKKAVFYMVLHHYVSVGDLANNQTFLINLRYD